MIRLIPVVRKFPVRPRRLRVFLSSAHGRFAARILARHRVGMGVAKEQARIFRHPAASPAGAQYLNFAGPRLAFRLNMQFARHAYVHQRARDTFVERMFHTRSAPSHSLLTRRDVVIDRLIARERRVDSTATVKTLLTHITERTSTAASIQNRTSAAVAPAVPMVVRRPAAPVLLADSAKPPSPPHSSTETWATPPADRRIAATPAPIPLSPGELGRLADHVMTAIDRKFTAHRERFGRA